MLEVGSKFFSPDSWCKVGLVSHKSCQKDPKCMSPNWLNVAGCDVLSTEGAKVSTLFDIPQHKRYFTNYMNQNKSSQKVGLAGWWRRRHHSPPILDGVMGKASIVHNLK